MYRARWAPGGLLGPVASMDHREVVLTRFVVDPGALMRILSEGTAVADEHELLAPTLVRSQLLSLYHEAVHRGDLDAAEARARLALFNKMKLRLLGDAVLRRRAWELADRLGWAETYDAEYLALTQLQGDALVTMNDKLVRTGVVPIATIADLES